MNKNTQPSNNDELFKLLNKIHQQNIQVQQKIDQLQKNLERKASMAGAVAGAFTGGLAGGVVGVGVQLIKAKFGL